MSLSGCSAAAAPTQSQHFPSSTHPLPKEAPSGQSGSGSGQARMYEVTSTSGSVVTASGSSQIEQQEESSTVFNTAPRHVHFHMHMHHPALAPAPSCLLQHHELSCGSADNTTANFGRSLHQLQADISCSAAQEQSASTPTLQQRPADHQDQPCGRPLSLAYPAMPRQTSICELTLTDSSTSSSRPAVQANNVQPADAGLPIPSAQTRKPSKRNGVRSAMRALLATGAATAAVLAGAATAIAVLSPRVEQLEGRCLQVMQQNRKLEQQTATLAAAKQQLEQQLQQLEAAKQQVDERIQELNSQQGGLAADNAQLRYQLNALHDSQQQLQHTAKKLHNQVARTAEKIDYQQQQQLQLVERRQPEAALTPAPAGCTSKPGDLSVQVTVPGFTDALVSRIGDAELVPQFAEALVAQVKQTGLVQHAVDSIVVTIGQAVSGVVCPWKWKVAVPWQKPVKHDATP